MVMTSPASVAMVTRPPCRPPARGGYSLPRLRPLGNPNRIAADELQQSALARLVGAVEHRDRAPPMGRSRGRQTARNRRCAGRLFSSAVILGKQVHGQRFRLVEQRHDFLFGESGEVLPESPVLVKIGEPNP